MGLRKAYDELTNDPEFTDGLTLQDRLDAQLNDITNVGAMDSESLHTVSANISEKNMIPKYNTTDEAPDDAGLYVAENEGRLAFKEVN